MKKICGELGLFADEGAEVVRVPHLIKGRVVAPPEMAANDVIDAFTSAPAEATYIKAGPALLVREPVIDRKSLHATGRYLYQVFPAVGPDDLIERDLDGLVSGLYALSFAEIEDYLRSLIAGLDSGRETVERIRRISLRVSAFPDAYHDAAFMSFPVLLDPAMGRAMVDNELAAWGLKGSSFLDGWVQVPASIFPGLVALLAGKAPAPAPACLRAMPTRQLHITAGNSPAVPVVSALRAMLTKSAAAIKLPYGATIPGALLALLMAAAAPDHPITKNFSIAYWPGGDEGVEGALLGPGAFDRIVVWGAPEAVASVRQRALFTRAVYFNPRYGVSMIGREAFGEDLDKVAALAAADVMIWNQKACIASQVHYVEGGDEQARRYAEALRGALAGWDERAPQYVDPGARGRLKRMQRGKYINAEWLLNRRGDEFSSGVVLMPGEFDILDHPMCRLVAVRRVGDLREALEFLHHGVSTAGIYPETRRLELRDHVLARGVSNAFPLGQCERLFGGMAHDGMLALSNLVDWKNG
ncbi:MAG TPA: acyl-CoA reductase [bacterium]|nr:acyl-CoA reductase [bacterium]